MVAAPPIKAMDRSGAVVGGMKDVGINDAASPPPSSPSPNMPRLATGGIRHGEPSVPSGARNRQHPVRHSTKIDMGARISDVTEIHSAPEASVAVKSTGLGSMDAASRMPFEPSRVMAATATIHPIGSRLWKPCSFPECRESDFAMESVLEEIVARKRVEVEKARLVTPIASIKDRIAELGRPRNFFRAVVADRRPKNFRVIAEVKRQSPSAGVIREDFDPADIASRYHSGGAAAISCLTDRHYFGGDLGHILPIKDRMPLPVLRKDFIVDEYQVWESRAAGADAILLIAEVLSEAQIIDYQILATELGMTSLVEVHSIDNLYRVLNHVGFPHSGYSLLGVNNRDLSTMTTDLAHTFRMLDLIEDPRVLVSESGIRTSDDLRRLRDHGINIALVGEHLLREEDPGAALSALLAGLEGNFDVSG
jgi:indole-3-glycerol phosphate synthase